MKACDIMTWGVFSVEESTPVVRAAQIMLQRNVSGLPVVDATGRLVGIVTEGDFLRRRETGTQHRRPRWLEFLIGPGRLANEYVRACGRKVGEIMSRNPYTVAEDTPLEAIVTLMEQHRIKRVPVVADERPIGIVSRANLLWALARSARDAKPATSDDSAIQKEILSELGKQFWAPQIQVIVRNGVVDLSGVIADERQRQAIIVAAENAPGVKLVHDHLVWLEPMSGMFFQSEKDEAQAQAS